MRRDEALRILRAHKDELAEYKVKSLAIFGSVARDEAGPDSDVDVLVEFSEPIGIFEFIDLKFHLEKLMTAKIDLATPGALREQMKQPILREAVYA